MKKVEEQLKIEKGVDTLVNEKELKEQLKMSYEQKAIPDHIPELVIDCQKDMLSDVICLLVANQYVNSNSDFKRLLKQGGIRINNEKIEDTDMVLACNDVIQIGKKKFVEIIK